MIEEGIELQHQAMRLFLQSPDAVTQRVHRVLDRIDALCHIPLRKGLIALGSFFI